MLFLCMSDRVCTSKPRMLALATSMLFHNTSQPPTGKGMVQFLSDRQN